MDLQWYIDLLGLKPLAREGGFYRETYRSDDAIAADALPARCKSAKSVCTAIYYMLTPETFSALHRLPADEIYHFYLGDPVTMLLLHPDGRGETITLGQNIANSEFLQYVVPKGVWQGSFLAEGGRIALMGTTMSPGYDPADLEMADRDALSNQYPSHSDLIRLLAIG